MGQRAVGAEQAAVVYALDPVWGALFAHYLLGKKKHNNSEATRARGNLRAT